MANRKEHRIHRIIWNSHGSEVKLIKTVTYGKSNLFKHLLKFDFNNHALLT